MRIGVLGGGQLGRMLGQMGIALGADFRFWDPSSAAPAASVGELICGQYDDEAAFAQFARELDVVTYEFENIPISILNRLISVTTVLERDRPPLEIRPGRRALLVSQDRADEKRFFAEAGVATGEWMQADSLEEIHSALEIFGESIVKTRRFGYDGKGQHRIASSEDCVSAWESLGNNRLVVEKVVNFDRELSLIGVRGVHGETRMWPLVENVHKEGILHRTTAPAPALDESMQACAEVMLTAVMEALNYIGVLTIEFFQVGDKLLANEMAPRVHNSGHWTIEGAVTCQFENHIRAISGLPLGSTVPRCPSVMLNCIGSMPPADQVLRVEGVHLHDYGKSPRIGRKVGHITVCDEPPGSEALDAKVAMLEDLVVTARTQVPGA